MKENKRDDCFAGAVCIRHVSGTHCIIGRERVTSLYRKG